MKNFINQLRTGDCGLTCLKIVLSIINKSNEYLSIDDKSLDDCTFLDLINKAHAFNLTLTGVNCNNIKLLKTPFVAHVVVGNISHFVVVKKITKLRVVVLDPGFRILRYKHADFLNIFQGNALIVKENHKKRIIINHLPALKVNLLLRVVGTLCLLAALSFINQNSQFVLSLLLFLLCAIIGIATHVNLMYIMKKFDQVFPLNENNLELISELKSKYFARRLKLFNSAMICLITAIILIYNETLLAIIIGFIAVIIALDKRIRNKYLNDKYIKQQLLGCTMGPFELLSSSYKLAHINTFCRALVYFTSICFLLVQMEVLKVVSLNYFIFYYGALIFLYENLSTAISENGAKVAERNLFCRAKNHSAE